MGKLQLVAQAVIPIVSVYENHGAISHGEPRQGSRKEEPRRVAEPDPGGIKPESPWILG